MTNKDIFRELGGLNAHTVLDAAPDKPVGAPVWLRITAAAACAVLILAGALAAPHLLPDTPSLPVENSGETSGQPTTQPITQPVTPPVTEPQKPVFNTVVRTLSLANSPEYGMIGASIYPETFTFSYNPDETFNLDDHRACGNVCYNAADGYFFCPGCTLKELLKDNKSIDTDKIFVKHFSPAQNKALFICGRKSYIYDFKTGELKNVNVDLYNTATLMVRDMSEKDGAYALILGTPGYWLVNLDTAEIVQVAKAGKDGKNLPTMDDYTFISRGQKYVYYALAEGDYAATKQGTTVFLNLETRERTLVTGLVCDGTPDDHYFTLETEDGLMVFDTEKNAVVPFEGSGMPDVYRYSLWGIDNNTYYKYSVIDMVTNQTLYTFDAYTSEFCYSRNRQYIYLYVRDESALRVFDLTTMQEGIAPLDEAFLTAMAEQYKEFEVRFKLSESQDGAILLSYVPSQWDRPYPEE